MLLVAGCTSPAPEKGTAIGSTSVPPATDVPAAEPADVVPTAVAELVGLPVEALPTVRVLYDAGRFLVWSAVDGDTLCYHETIVLGDAPPRLTVADASSENLMSGTSCRPVDAPLPPDQMFVGMAEDVLGSYAVAFFVLPARYAGEEWHVSASTEPHRAFRDDTTFTLEYTRTEPRFGNVLVTVECTCGNLTATLVFE